MRFFVFENFVWFIIRSLAPVWPDWIIFERPVQQKRPKSVMTFWAFWKVSLFKLKLRWLLFTSTAWKIGPLFFHHLGFKSWFMKLCDVRIRIHICHSFCYFWTTILPDIWRTFTYLVNDFTKIWGQFAQIEYFRLPKPN